MMHIWRKLSSAVFIFSMNSMSGADASYIKNNRSACYYLKFFGFNRIIYQSLTMTHLGCPVALENQAKVCFYMKKQKQNTKQKIDTVTGQVYKKWERNVSVSISWSYVFNYHILKRSPWECFLLLFVCFSVLWKIHPSNNCCILFQSESKLWASYWHFLLYNHTTSVTWRFSEELLSIIIMPFLLKLLLLS